MPKKKTARRKSISQPHFTDDHHSLLLILAGALVVILCLYFFGAAKLIRIPNQYMQPVHMLRQEGITTPKMMLSVVQVTSEGFAPSKITIRVGESVTFTNSDSVSHTAAFDQGTLDTGIIGPGESKTVKFSTAGTYSYHDTYYLNLTGTILVQ